MKKKAFDVDKFLASITPQKELELACNSAYYHVAKGKCTRQDVMNATGLCELSAARALKILVAEGGILKNGLFYTKNLF